MEIFLINLLQFVNYILYIYMWIAIIAALVSWVSPDPYNPIVRFLSRVTEPVYARVRRLIPTNFGGLDVAPMLLIFAILLIQRVIIGSLLELLSR